MHPSCCGANKLLLTTNMAHTAEHACAMCAAPPAADVQVFWLKEPAVDSVALWSAFLAGRVGGASRLAAAAAAAATRVACRRCGTALCGPCLGALDNVCDSLQDVLLAFTRCRCFHDGAEPTPDDAIVRAIKTELALVNGVTNVCSTLALPCASAGAAAPATATM